MKAKPYLCQPCRHLFVALLLFAMCLPPFKSAAAASLVNAQTIDTVANLKALDPASLNSPGIAILQGYNSIGDGGGGEFRFISGSGVDDGGIILVSTHSGTTGFWQRIFSGPVNLRWFGAKAYSTDSGDMTANNAAFLSALGKQATGTATLSGGSVSSVTVTATGSGYAYTPSVIFSGGGASVDATGTVVLDSSGAVASVTITSGGSGYTSAPTVTISAPRSRDIFVPAGNYYFNQTITIPGGTAIRGERGASQLTFYRSSMGDSVAFSLQANNDITFESLAIAGGNTTGRTCFQGSSSGPVKYLRLLGCKFTGFDTAVLDVPQAQLWAVEDCQFIGNHAASGSNALVIKGGAVGSGGHFNAITFRGCYFNGNDEVANIPAGGDISFIDSRFESNGRYSGSDAPALGSMITLGGTSANEDTAAVSFFGGYFEANKTATNGFLVKAIKVLGFTANANTIAGDNAGTEYTQGFFYFGTNSVAIQLANNRIDATDAGTYETFVQAVAGVRVDARNNIWRDPSSSVLDNATLKAHYISGDVELDGEQIESTFAVLHPGGTTSQKVEISHDGSNGKIESKTGDLRLQSTTAKAYLTSAGAVELYPNGSTKTVTASSSNFEVTTSTTFGGLTYSWPGSQSATTFLQNNGSGTLTWVSKPWEAGGSILSYDSTHSNVGIGSVSSLDYYPLLVRRDYANAVRIQMENRDTSSSASALFVAQSADANGYVGAFPSTAGAGWRANRFVVSAQSGATSGLSLEAISSGQKIEFYPGAAVKTVSMSSSDVTVNTPLAVNNGTIGGTVLQLSSGSTSADPIDLTMHAKDTTTSATAKNIFTNTLAASGTYVFKATVRAHRTGGSSGSADDSAAYIFAQTYKYVGGNAVVVANSSPAMIYSAEDQTAWDASFTTTGANVYLTVTGAANNNITWHATVQLSELTP